MFGLQTNAPFFRNSRNINAERAVCLIKMGARVRFKLVGSNQEQARRDWNGRLAGGGRASELSRRASFRASPHLSRRVSARGERPSEP